MKNKIKHLLVDLEEIDIPFSYVSEEHKKVNEIKKLLEELLDLL